MATKWRQRFWHAAINFCFMPFQSRTTIQPNQPHLHYPSVNSSLRNLFLNLCLKLADRQLGDHSKRKPTQLRLLAKVSGTFQTVSLDTFLPGIYLLCCYSQTHYSPYANQALPYDDLIKYQDESAWRIWVFNFYPDKTLSRAEIMCHPTLIPAVNGIYFRWLKEIPPNVPIEGCITQKGYTLLYIGISPIKKKSNSRANLRQRIKTTIAATPKVQHSDTRWEYCFRRKVTSRSVGLAKAIERYLLILKSNG
ncbi:TPA: hypothetical protein ACIJRN_002863 [Klebsiella aerogenes]